MTVSDSPGTAALAAPLKLWRRMGWGFRIGFIMLAVHLLAAIFGPWLAPFGPRELSTGAPLSGVSLHHLFGTDQLGRDVFSRVLHGAHLVILLSVGGTLAGLTLGAAIGLFSAYRGGWIDEIIQRTVEGFVSIPFIVLSLLAVHAAGPEWAGQPVLMVFVLTIVYAPRIARMARAAALDVITQDFVLAARLRGDPPWSVIWYEIAPNVTSTLIVEFALRTGYAPALIATLGFLGFGVQPPTPEWGSIISENRAVFLVAPMSVLGPGLWLATLVIAINMVTENISRFLGYRVEVANQ